VSALSTIASRGRCLPRWPAATGVALLVTALVGTGLWQIAARTYDPSLESSYFGYGGASRGGEALVHKSGAVFEVRFNITNRGSRPVTLTGVSWPTLEDDIVEFDYVLMSQRVGTNLGKRVSVRAVVVEPNETRFLWARIRFQRCRNSRPTDILRLVGPVVHYRFLGVSRSTDLNLLRPVRVVVPANCP
jgi:hypothetical protein